MGEEEFSPHSNSYLWFRVKTFLWVFASCDGWWMVDSGAENTMYTSDPSGIFYSLQYEFSTYLGGC